MVFIPTVSSVSVVPLILPWRSHLRQGLRPIHVTLIAARNGP